MRRLALLLLVCVVLPLGVAACGDDPDPGVEGYNRYRQLEDARTDAESDLRKAIRAINDAAVAEDREAVLAAAEDGLDAAKAIGDALEGELDAARDLKEIPELADHAQQLETGLLTTQESLTYFEQLLQLALVDPFLEEKGNIAKVGTIAKKGADLAIDGEVEVRKADRKLALALGLKPRLDQLLDNPSPTGTTPTTTG
jgi:hypothetical protein